MRKDMHKVIVERPRRGARFKLKRAGDEDIERLPMHLGPGRHHALNGTRAADIGVGKGYGEIDFVDGDKAVGRGRVGSRVEGVLHGP